MSERWNQWIEAVDGTSLLRRWVLPLAAAAVLWFDPSSGLAKAILWGAGLVGLWNGRKALAAWENPAGALFGLGVLWALASAAWSFYPEGTARDWLKSAPMVLAALAIPVVFDRPRRIWAALLGSAGMVTITLAGDLVRLFSLLGWPWTMSAARFFHPYLYTHPNVSSMMAGLCALVFAARWLAGVPGRGLKVLLALGLLVDFTYLVVMASRGPQVVFALAALSFPVLLVPGWRVRLGAAGLALAVGAGLWAAADWVNPRFSDRTMAHFNNRDTVWGHARLLADQKPVVGYGFGKKTFVKAVYENTEQRAPRVPVRYPHAHSYWLMLYFQGGAVGFALWTLGWLALGLRLARYSRRAGAGVEGWRNRLQVRILPMLLGMGIAYILVYGIADFPDNVIRHAQFYLAGLVMALTLPSAPKDPVL
jgi:hypothetical protein